MKPIFVTGIGTDIGKTLVSTILVELLEADYWKPLQSGNTDQLDSRFVKEFISNNKTVIHPEKYVFSQPVSPHLAAQIDQQEVFSHHFEIPQTENLLIIEGAGGLMVPINEQETILDLIQSFGAAVVVVHNYYLGSINHTLLTLNALQQRKIPVLGLIGNGEINKASEEIIFKQSKTPLLGHVNKLKNISKESIKDAKNSINKSLLLSNLTRFK